MTALPLSVTPLEMLSLAETYRRDRDLALRMAERSAADASKPTLKASEKQVSK